MSAEIETPRPASVVAAWRRSVLATFGLAGFGIANWLSRIPAARQGLHASTLEMGVLALGISIGSIAGFAIAGRVGGRWAPRTVITAALSASAVALAGGGVSVLVPGALPWAMASMILLGLGNGTCNVVMNIEGNNIAHAIGRPIMPQFHALFSIGAAAGAGLGAVCAALGVSLSAQLIVIAVAMACALPVIARHLTGAPPRVTGTGAAPLAGAEPTRGSAWREPRTLLIGLVVLGMSFANGAASDWIALGMVDGHGVADGTAAATVNVFSLAVVLVRLLGTGLLGRLGRTRTVQASAFVALIGLLGFVFAPSTPLAFASAVLWGSGVALGFPIGMAAAGDDPARAAGRIAVVAAIGYAGSLVGPPLIGFLAGGSGILHALLIVPVLVLAAGLAAPVLRGARR